MSVPSFLSNPDWPPNVAAILLRMDGLRPGIEARGTFQALTREQIEDGSALCGIRADAIVFLDQHTEDTWRAHGALPLLVAGMRRKPKGLTE